MIEIKGQFTQIRKENIVQHFHFIFGSSDCQTGNLLDKSISMSHVDGGGDYIMRCI